MTGDCGVEVLSECHPTELCYPIVKSELEPQETWRGKHCCVNLELMVRQVVHLHSWLQDLELEEVWEGTEAQPSRHDQGASMLPRMSRTSCLIQMECETLLGIKIQYRQLLSE